ncbi:MAG: hypothetical protein ACFE91_01585 [Promethearchaeota archaeon]
MPRGMFLLIHDEIRGPEIKSSFYTNPVTLSKEFISKLYMSHAGFESSAHIEIKFENYRCISCFTGNLDRRSQKEGILGIIFEESEEFNNLDLFLQRNLYDALDKPDSKKIEEIFSNKLLNFLKLSDLFTKIEIEGIQQILVIKGNSEYKSNLLKIGNLNISTPEMVELYQKFIKNQSIPQYQYVELNLGEKNKTFLVLKMDRSTKILENIITILKPYLENFFYYSLEILSLLLAPSVIKIIPLNLESSKRNLGKSQSFLKSLQKSNNYCKEFNETLLNLLRENIYICPFL